MQQCNKKKSFMTQLVQYDWIVRITKQPDFVFNHEKKVSKNQDPVFKMVEIDDLHKKMCHVIRDHKTHLLPFLKPTLNNYKKIQH